MPLGGSEFEQAILGPTSDHAEQVPEVAVGLDSVQTRAGEQRDEDGVHGSAVVAAEENEKFRRYYDAARSAANDTGAREWRTDIIAEVLRKA